MMNISANALTVLKSRYLQKDKEGNIIETPEELFQRVAKAVAKAELLYGDDSIKSFWEEKFYNLISSLQFLPNSPTLINAGLSKGQLSACYVLPIKNDSNFIDCILNTALEIQKSGGGTGFNFSSVFDNQTNDTNAVNCIEKFDHAMEGIQETGKRRGANMAIIDIDHPDIGKFIHSKDRTELLRNFNISVGMKNSFMYALEKNEEWALIDPINQTPIKKLKAKILWDAIIQAAWETGDPGLVFLDTIEADNPTPDIGELNATNPCGEVPLLPYEACNLGSINLLLMIKQSNNKFEIDWDKLADVVNTSIRFLDDVIDVNNYMFPEIENIVKGNRKIGLGVMGWASLLVKLEIAYDSEEAIELGRTLMKFIKDKSADTSMELAKERGAFPNWKHSIYYPDTPIRNATRNSIAPTGTISIIADTSSSIEPFFALSFHRKNILDGVEMFEINPLFEEFLIKHDLKDDEGIKKILERGMLEESDKVPAEVFRLFKTSMQIPYSYHIKHQEAFQLFTDNAVSKTINIPSNATYSDIDFIYKTAWKNALKGITVYRYGSKDKQVLYKGIKNEITTVDQDGYCKFCVE